MKLIHTSDIHLDSPLTSRLTPLLARERKRELTATFRAMIDDAVRIDAKGFIIAGDLFDNENVGASTLESVMGFIDAAPEITFFYLPGNHEKNRLLESGIAIPKNLKMFGEDWTCFKLGEVTVAGKTKITDDTFANLTLSQSDINIVTLHGMLCDRSASPDKIGLREASELPIDYLALGHYHTYSETKLKSRGTAVYSGTPEGRGFDEAGDKGYVIIDTDTPCITHTFVKRASRTLHIIPVDISGADREIEIENRVAYAISQINSRDLVRVRLVGEYEPGVKRDTESLTDRFSSRFYYFETKDESRLRISSEDYKNDKSLKGEFIRLVLSRDELTSKEKEDIIECGIRALAGETI
jgi:DNA repair exonuclease SbcCD nuclease subunit